MRRRTFLGTLGMAATAGCSSSNGSGGDPRTHVGATTNPDPDSATTATPDPDSADTPHLGVSLTPRSGDPEDFTAFFERVATADLTVRWAGDWAELGMQDAAPVVVAQLGDTYDYPPVIDVGVYSVNDNRLFRPLDEETVENYVADARAFAEEFTPPYMGLGVEVNVHATEEPTQFETFTTLFQRASEAVKAVSPRTKVYTSMQLEWFLGLRGGLFGGEDDTEQAQWDLLDAFDSADLVGFTTYPGLAYHDPADIPDDYYAAVADRVGTPLAIVETGWPHRLDVDGWESSEAEQVKFVDRLFALLSGVDVELLLWAFMYQPPPYNPAFDYIALRRDDGTARPAWNEWVRGPG